MRSPTINMWFGISVDLSRELAVVGDDATREAVVAEAKWMASRSPFPGRVLFYPLWVIVMFFVSTAFWYLCWRPDHLAAVLFQAAVEFVIFWSGITAYEWFQGTRVRRLFREHLLRLGLRICLHCGTQVPAESESQCQVCGRALDPRLLASP